MSRTVALNIHHLPRVEGHGNIVIRVQNGELKEARWEVIETPRYFEMMLRGKRYSTSHILTSRICGICSISHSLASLRATENAFGLTIPYTAELIRHLAKHGETLQSHILHLFFLAAPDFFDVPSVVQLIEQHPEVVKLAANLKSLGNRLSELAAGRTTHPVSFCVGGVTTLPDYNRLLTVRDELTRSLDDLEQLVAAVKTFEIPQFVRDTEFVSLQAGSTYPFIGGELHSSDGIDKPETDYLAMTNEFVERNNTSKWCKLSRESFAVGPLARFNNNHRMLQPHAQEIATELGLKAICSNPFKAHYARLVECAQVILESLKLIDELMSQYPRSTVKLEVKPRPGEGVGAIEAPRGILYHYYKYDQNGIIKQANCIIPTTQNNLNIQHDLSKLVKDYSAQNLTDKKLELLSSMLVRSYDPCISCSVH